MQQSILFARKPGPSAESAAEIGTSGAKWEASSAQDAPGIKWQHIAAATIGNALEFYDF